MATCYKILYSYVQATFLTLVNIAKKPKIIYYYLYIFNGIYQNKHDKKAFYTPDIPNQFF